MHFSLATTIMSSSEYPTLSMVVPLYHILYEILDETQKRNNAPQCLIEGCQAAITKLLGYCQKTNVWHISAIVLDPRLKFQYFEELGWSSQLITQIKDRLVCNIKCKLCNKYNVLIYTIYIYL